MFHHSCFVPVLHYFQTQTLLFFRQTNLVQATLTSPRPSSWPFRRNLLNFCSITLTTFLGRVKMLDQYIWILFSTDWMICSLPENESCLAVQVLIRAVIFSINGTQSWKVSLLEISGIPKYLTGRLLSLKFKMERICDWRVEGTAAKNTSLLDWFTERPDIILNTSKASLIRLMDTRPVATKIIKSSAILRWVNLLLCTLWMKFEL